MSATDPAAGGPTQEFFTARLSLRVDRAPRDVVDEWSERFTALRERADYEGCRELLRAAKGWPSLPDHARGIVYYAEGWLLDRLGEPAQAIMAYQRATNAFVRAGVDVVIPTLLTQIGSLHQDMGDLGAAEKVYTDALESAHGPDRGRLLVNVGNLAIARGDPDRAQGAYREALELLDPDDRRNVAAARHGLANALQSLGDLPGAQREFAAAYTAFREESDIFGAAGAVCSLGVLEIMAGDPAQAVRLLEHGLTLFTALQDTRRVAETLNNLAIAHDRAGQPDAAEAAWHESASVYRTLCDDDAADAVVQRASRVPMTGSPEHQQATAE